ncbi:fumarate hydratase [Anaeromicrobium sediminis]|uniref:Fumarate hydratase n=1 Tax=Anaeromicrobium sediminis TaxID=1478221 RepID=A0A267MKL6_9FIRM|nr:fumarate hydratase [Anaeromicrobium sediminis]PAB60076.1 fumarate hydratase [Anaeromicrobium sediminis]
MREVHVRLITDEVERMCIHSNKHLSKDVVTCLEKMKDEETWPSAKDILELIIQNAETASNTHVPMCQDTGLVVVFLEVGQEVQFKGGYIEDAINEGVRRGYDKGQLRKSVVRDPLTRENTGDNTPCIIHHKIVKGDKVKLTVIPKGFGSENMSRIYMLKPSQGVQGVIESVLETVEIAGPNPCPPIVVGVGIGGTFEKAALLAKKALIRPLGSSNEDSYYAQLEETILNKVNDLGIGPQGFGGKTTALKVHIETAPTHIAGLPVAINIGCHAYRHMEVTI